MMNVIMNEQCVPSYCSPPDLGLSNAAEVLLLLYCQGHSSCMHIAVCELLLVKMP